MASNILRPKECPICMDEKTELKALPCHPDHVFCLLCLEKHRRDRREFTCPTCKTLTRLQPNHSTLASKGHPARFEGETAASLESRYFGFMECKVCSLNKRTDRLRWCVECRAYLCVPCAEGDEHWAEKHTTSPFHALAGLRAATALISEKEQAIESLGERIEDFCKALCSRLKGTLGQESPKHGEKLRAMFHLPDEGSSGGLSDEEAAAIANLALEMMGETGDVRLLAATATVRMPRVEAAETWVLNAIADAASHRNAHQAAATSSSPLPPATAPVPSAVPILSSPPVTGRDASSPTASATLSVATTSTSQPQASRKQAWGREDVSKEGRLGQAQHLRPAQDGLNRESGEQGRNQQSYRHRGKELTPLTAATRPPLPQERPMEVAEARLVILTEENIEVVYPFSSTPSVTRSFDQLRMGRYDATALPDGPPNSHHWRPHGKL